MAGAVRPARAAVGLVAALALAPLLTVRGQPPGSAAKPISATEAGTTVYLVVRTKPSVPERRVTGTITAGLAASNTAIDGPPGVKPVSPLFFDQFAELIGTPQKAAVAADADGQVGIAPLPSKDSALHEVRLPSPKQTLTKFRVRYVTGPDDKPVDEEYTPKGPGEGPLTLIEPGRYAFRPATGRVPKDYLATYDERNEKTRELLKDRELKGVWPAGDRFYVVTLKNFRRKAGEGRANHEELLQAIERQNTGENVANPINITRLGGDQVFVFADMAGQAATPPPPFEIKGNSLVVRVPGLPKRNTKRAWMLFPLSEKEYDESVRKYAGTAASELPAEIRKAAVAAGQEAAVSAEKPAKWVEIPADPNSPGNFYREVRLDNLPAMAVRFPQVWQLTVWEFEGQGAGGQPVREAIEVQGPGGQDVTALGGRILNWTPEKGAAIPKTPETSK